MIRNKYIDGLAAVLMLSALLLILFFAKDTDSPSSPSTPDYATALFGEIMTVDILADEDQWQTMLDNAADETYICVDVVINGQTFSSVGLRPKGNSSLTQVLQSDSDRYSFRLQFDEYIDGQTCFGLDSLVLNNMISDDSYMREYISYEMMRQLGVAAPYTTFANITRNGQDLGFYLAVELYRDSYESRVFGDTLGMLYNVKSMEMGAKTDIAREQNAKTPPTFEATTPAQDSNPEASFADRSQAGGMPGGRGGDTGGTLQYTGDASDDYSAIFGNVVGNGSEDDYQRVITALEALSQGRDLERYFDIDQTLRYLAAHTFVVNLDSYSSNMAQNYYLYEKDGKVTILPWDYNLAWGGFQSGNASSVINFPIDTPVSGISVEERPLIAVLLANEDYLARYHSHLQTLIDHFFKDNNWSTLLTQLDDLIGNYVKNDPTAFCTYTDYQSAVANLQTLGSLRAESIQGQLDGTIPATTALQAEYPDTLISPGELTLSASHGGGQGGGEGGRGGHPNATDTATNPMSNDSQVTPTRPTLNDSQSTSTMAGRQMQKQGLSDSTRTYLMQTGLCLFALSLALVLVLRCKRRY